MKIDFDSLNQGFAAGIQRTRGRFDIGPSFLPDFAPRLVTVLDKWENEADPRFAALFAELWTVAEIARIGNKEPRLSEEEISSYLDHTSSFFNSFKHK